MHTTPHSKSINKASCVYLLDDRCQLHMMLLLAEVTLLLYISCQVILLSVTHKVSLEFTVFLFLGAKGQSPLRH